MITRRPLSVKPALETLEDRSLLTTATLSSGVLNVLGTEAAETIRISQSGTRITVEGVGYANTASVRSIMVNARGGNDFIDLRTMQVGSTVYAGTGNDVVIGTQATDYLFGNEGNDRLFGLGGSDALYGQDSNDFLDDGNRSAQEYADGGAGMDWNADVAAIAGTQFTDIHQRQAPTCGLLSSLSGLARLGYDFSRWISYAGFTSNGTPQYDVAFWRGSGWTWTRIQFDGSLTSLDPAPAVEGESWVILMQRAWIRFRGDDGRTWPHDAILALTGRASAVQYSVSDADFIRISNAVQNKQLVIAATVDQPASRLLVAVPGGHAYTVVGTWGSGSNLWVQVRNPWGYDGGSEAYENAQDGLIWLRWSDFRANMKYLAIS
jgi:hypothetical protein